VLDDDRNRVAPISHLFCTYFAPISESRVAPVSGVAPVFRTCFPNSENRVAPILALAPIHVIQTVLHKIRFNHKSSRSVRLSVLRQHSFISNELPKKSAIDNSVWSLK
jgi:hypothetical protein